MISLFRPLEEDVASSVLTVDALGFIVFMGSMLQCSSDFVCLPVVECDISAVKWILGFYYLD
jgi:hypothetical protein